MVGSAGMNGSSVMITAGRSPACAWPGAKGICTCHTSPCCIVLPFLRQALDQFQGFGASPIPGVEFFLQLRWDFDRSVDDADLHECPFGQWGVWHDYAVLDEARNGDRHG